MTDGDGGRTVGGSSPDKSPASAAHQSAQERVEASGAPAALPPKHEAHSATGRFLADLWSTNTVTVTVLSLFAALVIGGVLTIVSDKDTMAAYSYIFARPGDALGRSWSLVAEAYANLLKGAVLDPAVLQQWLDGQATWRQVLYPISETLTYSTPLVFTGLSVALAFRSGLFNIGSQGQATIGVICAALVGFLVPLPVGLHLVAAVLAGALGGAAWGFLPGILKARTGAHEVINTIMLNYVAFAFLTWIVHQRGVQDPQRTDFISRQVDASAQLPRLLGGTLRVDAGLLVAIAATAAVAWLLARSTIGFELRAVGANPDASRTAGISVGSTLVLAMSLSGALAGLGGGQMVLGATASALTTSVVAQIGFDGILVALLGRAKPWGVALAALLFGALRAGGNAMQSASGISLELVTVLQALIVIFIAAPALVKGMFRLRAARQASTATVLTKGW